MDETAYSGKLTQTSTPVTEQTVSEIHQRTSPKSLVRSWSHSNKTADETLDVLLPGITNITNTSQVSGVVPLDFKKAIKPLLKINPSTK